MITFEDIQNNEEIKTYITCADESLKTLGFTEHSFAHVTRVSRNGGVYPADAGLLRARRWSWRASRAICTISATLSTASSIRKAAR